MTRAGVHEVLGTWVDEVVLGFYPNMIAPDRTRVPEKSDTAPAKHVLRARMEECGACGHVP